MASTPNPPLVAVILGSSRQPRVCPQIADFVIDTYKTWTTDPKTTTPTSSPPTVAELKLIDLATWNLPFFDEPTIPSQVRNHLDYGQPHTRAWSVEIQKYSGFIFILPQYNWGYPAVLKNAIDYLFHEWHGKPAMIVSYGGHGGVKSAAQFREVLHGVRMRVVETMPALSFPSRAEMVKASKGESLNLVGEEASIWDSERPVICEAFKELSVLLRPDGNVKKDE